MARFSTPPTLLALRFVRFSLMKRDLTRMGLVWAQAARNGTSRFGR
jgi:hypothetical protein